MAEFPFLCGIHQKINNAIDIQWNLHNTDTVGTTSFYRGVPTSEVSGIFLVGMAMRTRAVEHFEGAFPSSPLPYDDKKG